MATWLNHIDLFKHQYNNSFAINTIFGVDLLGKSHKWVQVFLNLCNATKLDDVDTTELTDFREIYQKVEQGEWMWSTPLWVEFPSTK